MQSNEFNITKSKNTFVFLFLGCLVLIISIFLPYLVATVPNVGQVSENGFGTSLGFFLLVAAIICAVFSGFKFTTAMNRDEMKSSNKFALIAVGLSAISVLLYVFSYSLGVTRLESQYGSTVTGVSFGIGNVGFVVGTVFLFLGHMYIDKSTPRLPNYNTNPNYADPLQRKNQRFQNLVLGPGNPQMTSLSKDPPVNPIYEDSPLNTISENPFCSNCGARLNANEMICSNCGVRR